MRTEFFVVDRIEGGKAVIQDEAGSDHMIPSSVLGPSCSEGSVLRVSVDDRGDANWESAVVDSEETERRRAEAQARIDQLRNRG